MRKEDLKKNSIMRLKKERDLYIKELEQFETDLKNLSKATDIYKKRLLSEQIDETRKALEMVNKRLLDFEASEM